MTPEHAQARCGRATASEFSSVLAKGQGKTRAAYLRRVVAEMLTGKPCETYRNGHMDRGVEQEPFARMAYEARTGNIVDEVPFIPHGEIAAGCSPDGLIDEDGGGEFKSVIPTVQIETIESGRYPTEHRAQVQGCLWITGRTYWDFCSFCPDMPTPELRVYIFRVFREEEYIANLDKEVRAFLKEAEAMRDRLLGKDVLTDQLRESLKAVA